MGESLHQSLSLLIIKLHLLSYTRALSQGITIPRATGWKNELHQQALRQEVKQVMEDLHKEKSHSEAYKSKAIEAHMRSVKVEEVLDLLCKHHDGPVLSGLF